MHFFRSLLWVSLLVVGLLAACGRDMTRTKVGPGPTSTAVGGEAGQTATGGMAGAGGHSSSSNSSSSSASGGQGGSASDILEQLQKLPGVKVSESSSNVPGYRFFEIAFAQPADHHDLGGLWFDQRIELLHRDVDAPLVLYSTGYGLWWEPHLDEVTALLGANQLRVEHRFFSPSRPSPADWTLLNVEQAAADHHRIVEAFKPIYSAAWLSSGISKGGMTSIYHRRFYPADVAGTVAYVAPHSSGPDDPRYVEYLAKVGDEACRKALRDFQREVLLRRSQMLVEMAALAASQNISFNFIGIDQTLESDAKGFQFAFWQYFGADRCSDIPSGGASDTAVWSFFNEIARPRYSADDFVLAFEPYYWQAETELGYPAGDSAHLTDLLLYDLDAIDWLPSIPLEPVYDPTAMADISSWITIAAERIMLIYGADDPWTAAAFDLGAAKDSFSFMAAGANHSAEITDLSGADQNTALAALEAWTGVKPYEAKPPSPRPPARLLRMLRPRPSR